MSKDNIFKIQLKVMREEIAVLYSIRTELEFMNALNEARIANFNGKEYDKYELALRRDKIDNFINSKMEKIDNLIEEVQDD